MKDAIDSLVLMPATMPIESEDERGENAFDQELFDLCRNDDYAGIYALFVRRYAKAGDRDAARDAARYRWLRAHPPIGWYMHEGDNGVGFEGDFDRSVDEMLERDKGLGRDTLNCATSP